MKKYQYVLGSLSLLTLCMVTGCGNSVTVTGDKQQVSKEEKETKKTKKNKDKEKATGEEETKEKTTRKNKKSGSTGEEETTEEGQESKEKKNKKKNQTQSDQLTEEIYKDFSGDEIYIKEYVYYENGQKCSETLCSYEHYENYDTSREETYLSPLYTILFLYDEHDEISQAVMGNLSLPDNYNSDDGSYILKTDYSQDGEKQEIIIYPFEEDIDQKKFNVDASKTEQVYGKPVVLDRTDAGKWAENYLETVFSGEPVSDWTTCDFAYIDDDSVPEIWVNGNYGYAGAHLYTCDEKGRNSDEIIVSQGIVYYREGENKFLASSGHTGFYEDDFYEVSDGSFVLKATGNFSEEYTGDIDAEPDIKYYWDNEEVSESTYQNNYEDRIDDIGSYHWMEEKKGYSFEQMYLLLESVVSNND